MSGGAKPYHHGGLREAVIVAAVAEIEAVGPAGISLRAIARRAGVSHGAPVHHFGDKTGLFTAIATEGFRKAAETIGAHAVGEFGFLDGGAAYIAWALANPGYFEVMYRPRLYRHDDPALIDAKAAAFEVLEGSAAELGKVWGIDDAEGLVLAGWSMTHGLATLLLAGNLQDRLPATMPEIRAHLEQGLVGLGTVVAKRLGA